MADNTQALIGRNTQNIMDNRHKKYKFNQDVVSATMVILITAIGAQKTEKLLY